MRLSEHVESNPPLSLLLIGLIVEATVKSIRILSSLPYLLTTLLLAGAAPLLQAGDYPQEQSEAQVKAGYITKFEKYATWPQDTLPPGAPIEIGIVGAATVARELESRDAVNGGDRRRIKVKRLQQGDSLEGVHILFIGSDKSSEIDDWLSNVQGKPVLTVTEAGGRMPSGSMINFVRDGGRVRFDVSLTAADRGRIKLSAALLTVARQVYGGKA
ncbi:MAG TPA: YfiR family protein [Methylophilaceae bacterium]|nr:YfiR family protein [Methylophilaceae bacterium]